MDTINSWDYCIPCESLTDPIFDKNNNASSYSPDDTYLDERYPFRHSIPVDFICPYCRNKSNTEFAHIIKKRGKLLDQTHRVTHNRHYTNTITTNTYEIFFIRQCDHCFKKREQQKKGVFKICIFLMLIHLAILIFFIANNTPNLFGLIGTVEKILNKLRVEELFFVAVTGGITYLICSSRLKRKQRLEIDVEEAFKLDAVATKKEVNKKYNGDEDFL